MVKGKFQTYFPLKGGSWTYSCMYCRAHLALHDDLISKSFQGSQGRAYLFNQVVNVYYSEAKQRVLLTGVHFVADVYCACCQTMLGWKYERAFDASQRYKEGKVIVELAHLIKDNRWNNEMLSPSSSSRRSSSARSIGTDSPYFSPQPSTSCNCTTDPVLETTGVSYRPAAVMKHALQLNTLPRTHQSIRALEQPANRELSSQYLSDQVLTGYTGLTHNFEGTWSTQEESMGARRLYFSQSEIVQSCVFPSGIPDDILRHRSPSMACEPTTYSIDNGAEPALSNSVLSPCRGPRKPRCRKKGLLRRRTTSSSPSRAFLLSSASEDEYQICGDDNMASESNLISTSPTCGGNCLLPPDMHGARCVSP